MKTDKEIKDFAIKMEKVYSMFSHEYRDMDVCPYCKNESKYYANPFYEHTCQSCGTNMKSSELIHVSKRDLAIKEIKRFLEES